MKTSLNTLRDQAEQRWQQLPARDRRALTVLLLVLPVLLVTLFWWPSFAARDQARLAAVQAEQLLTQLRQEGPRLRQGAAAAPALAEMPTRLQQLAQAQGLTVDRIEPDNTGVKLQLSSVVLVSLTRFLEQSRQQGMPVAELQITRDGESFRAQLRFAG